MRRKWEKRAPEKERTEGFQPPPREDGSELGLEVRVSLASSRYLIRVKTSSLAPDSVGVPPEPACPFTSLIQFDMSF